ncbi:MAG: bifunctional folylpolyglutamate synthase/dihydrofolate synthase [Arcobacteraceae bacterium]|jgi:dihydrofolate synthase/folylpolyglutamate synthase|nr:bifunctional folylpolyglutamate synthase/dihydrofolate synthase [Arcobacteraceae bacterium]
MKINVNDNFLDFLNQKTLFYTKIEYDTIKKSWEILSKHIKLPYVIHIVGTNGKGTTGRFIATFLLQQNKKVLHYTSPHIVKFNERIWINGSNATDEQLENAHQHIIKILPVTLLEKLTYFEYTTLLALYLSSNFDFIVLEAGLGGEFDATNVVENNLTVVPSIGLDHKEFLGETIEEIASTKLRSCDNCYIFGDDFPNEVLSLKKTILKNKVEIPYLKDLNYNFPKHLPTYIIKNATLALSVMQYLGLYRDNFILEVLEGRCQKMKENITIDVGHNPLAANVILEEFKNKKITLIYNSYKDKDFKEILTILKPIIKEVLVIQCDDERMIDENILLNTLKELSLKADIFKLETIKKEEEYLVFGSFKVVEKFLSNF